MKQVLLHAVVGDKDVRESITIVVGKGHTQAVTFLGGNSRACSYVLESSVAAVMVENVGRARKLARRTVGVAVPAAVLAVLRVPLHIASDEEIKLAVVV